MLSPLSRRLTESAFAHHVNFDALMTSKLGTNEILMRSKMKWYPLILQVQKADEPKALSKAFLFCFGFRYVVL